MKPDFVDAFVAAKAHGRAPYRVYDGLVVMMKLAGWRLTPIVIWEFVTTFVMYLPASDIHLWVCKIVDKKWEQISDGDRQKVLSLLLRMDRCGEISKILENAEL